MKRKVRSILKQNFGIQTRLQEMDAHAETKRKATYFSSIFLVLSFTILFTTVGAPFLPFVSFILTRPAIKPKKKGVLNERLGHTWTYVSFGATEGSRHCTPSEVYWACRLKPIFYYIRNAWRARSKPTRIKVIRGDMMQQTLRTSATWKKKTMRL
jgi:hypothetical protein